ncbi:MAG: hypothetical protein AAGA66_10260 [Bacteroidota bacterium]
MIIWSGRGFLAPLVFISTGVLFTFLLPEGQSDLAVSIGFILAGVFSWVMGRKWNGEAPKTYLDQATNQQVVVKPNHTLFWIKIEYWGIVFGAIGLFRIVTSLLVG